MAALVGIGHAVVAATLRNGYRGHYTTVQAAIDAGETLIFVKAGQSIAGWNQNQNGIEVEAGPGVTVTSDLNITSNNCSLIGGPGFTVQGEIDVTTGVEAYIEIQNGGALQNIDLNSGRCYVNGGGWGTVAVRTSTLALDSSAADNIFENVKASGSGVYYSGTAITTRNILRLVKTDDSQLHSTGAGSDALVLGCCVAGGEDGLEINGETERIRIIGNRISHNEYGIGRPSGPVDSVIIGNVINSPGAGLPVGANANSVVVGNRLDEAPTVVSATATVAANDETAF